MNILKDMRAVAGRACGHDYALKFAFECDDCIQAILSYLVQWLPIMIEARKEKKQESALLELVGDARELLRLAEIKAITPDRLKQAIQEFDERRKSYYAE